VSLDGLATALLVFVGFYPVVTAGLWIGGALVFRVFEEHREPVEPAEAWPGVTILIAAFNEEQVIATCVRAALSVDYPELEVVVLDDGSTDSTADVAATTARGDERLRVVRDPVNRGKAERLNRGFREATHELVVVTDADTHLHPLAVRLLVTKLSSSKLIAAVGGGPHVTNRQNLLCVMQVLEAASIIGLIRRTQAVAGTVGVVAGVLALYRRDAVIEVGGFRGEMATEDIDLTWRLLMAGWATGYEPDALVGMEVPATPRVLWAQRRRWARGQGEVLHEHLGQVVRWRNRRLWPVALESVLSLVWVFAFVVTLVVTVLAAIGAGDVPAILLAFSWGIAVALVATIQLAFALRVEFAYDRTAMLAFVAAPIYSAVFWLVSAGAALRDEAPALVRGPAERRVVWDLQREHLHVQS